MVLRDIAEDVEESELLYIKWWHHKWDSQYKQQRVNK